MNSNYSYNTTRRNKAKEDYQKARQHHWDQVAAADPYGTKGWSDYYHQRIADIFQFIIPPKQRVIELGCAQGDLLAAMDPSVGIGLDFSSEMIRKAKKKYPQYQFYQMDVHNIDLKDKFDYVILSDVINDLWDVQTVFEQLHKVAGIRSRIVINNYSRLWELPLWVVKKLGLAKPTLFQNWFTVEDIGGLLNIAGFEIIKKWEEILLPLKIPIISDIFNKYLAKIWPISIFSLTHVIVARPIVPHHEPTTRLPSVSVIIPARNEAGNIVQVFECMPNMGSETELVFVEGNSTDNTYEVIAREIEARPERKNRLLRQTGEGKGDAVRLGFSAASGDILMILDADLTVSPEDLPRFYNALVSHKGEFINGVRLVYPMEKEAMRFLNLLGNKFFSLAFTWLFGQPIKDTLCGTKVLWKSDYMRIDQNRHYFGDFDPFGDFDLLFGAVKNNLKICEIPIRYRERSYGHTNIKRWQHGWLLLRMVLFALKRIKFT